MDTEWRTIGFDKHKKIFSGFLKQGFPGDSLLLYGPEMIGKKTFALDIAYFISGNKNAAADPNFLFIEPEENSISIDSAREVKKFLSLRPLGTDRKIVVIDDAYKMAEPAQSALLKAIEEPPAFALIILVSHLTDTILPTILSRCQRIYFPPHDNRIISVFLRSQGGLDEDQVDFLVKFASGKIGLLSEIFEKKSFNEIKSAAGQFLKLQKTFLAERLKFAEKMSNKKRANELNTLVLYWILYLRSKAKQNSNLARVLKNLLNLQYIISRPHFNHRLALENFVISL